MPTITEITEKLPSASPRGHLPIQIITPGWGSSGYYSAQVLENAAVDRVFPAGTQMFVDHPSESERWDRPERSVRDIAAVLTTDARWDNGALVAEAQVVGPMADVLSDKTFAAAVGVSIRADAEVTTGEAEGRKGQIVTRLTEGRSIDFVTRAGRGGRVLTELMESGRPSVVTERARARGVAEATANDTREQLSTALRAAYGAEKTWVYPHDFDDSTVWYRVEDDTETHLYAQGYTLSDTGAVTLADTRTEVRARTEYVPITQADTAAEAAPDVPAPAGRTTTTQEIPMGTIQVDEAEHGRLTEAAGRAEKAEAALAEAAQRAIRANARADAIEMLANSGQAFTALERKGLLAELPIKEDRLDVDAFKATVDAAVAEKATASGAGQVTGFGTTTATESAPTWSEIDKVLGLTKEG